MDFATRYKPPKSPSIDFTDSPSLARSEFEPECNINNILAKFKVTGVLVDPSVRNLRQPMFLDCTSIPDLETYHDRLNECSKSFDKLPEAVKEAFGFDARIAMQWLSNASDRQVVQLFKNLVPSDASPAPSKGGLGGDVTPQNSQAVASAPPATSAQGAESKSQEPPRSQVVDAVINGC